MKFMFKWVISGNTFIEAADKAAAQNLFDEMTTGDMEEAGNTDFAQDGIMVEVTPGRFIDLEDHTDDEAAEIQRLYDQTGDERLRTVL